MASSVPAPGASVPVRSLDDVRPAPAKARLASDRIGPAFASVLKAAIISHYGSVKAAAFALHVDASLMQREFDAGKFGRLDQADDAGAAKAAIARAVYDAFRDDDPQAHVRRVIREIRQRIDELAEVVIG